MKNKDLKYWKERGGQIEWRLEIAEQTVNQMKADLKECDDNIKLLESGMMNKGVVSDLLQMQKGRNGC